METKRLTQTILASSMVLGMISSTGMTTAMAATTGDAQTSSSTTTKKATPSSINVLTKGSTTFEGSNMLNGLTVSGDYTMSSGMLDIAYTGTTQFSLAFGEKTKTFISLPKEFEALAKATNNGNTFLDYIEDSSYFYAPNNIGEKKHTYQRGDITYDPDNNTLIFENNVPLYSLGLGETLEAHVYIDLGRAVTDLKTRIPDAFNHSGYQFASTVASENSTPDLNIIGDAEGDGFINWDKLDYGWEVINMIPQINTVTDNDLKISGDQAPAGSKVTVHRDSEDGPVVGTAIATANGRYTFNIDKTLEAGTKLFAEQTTPLGTKGFGTTTVQHEVLTPQAPVVDQNVVTQPTPIVGKVVGPYDKLVCEDKMHNKTYDIKVEADGSFVFDTRQIPKVDLPTTLTFTTHNGDLVSEEVQVIVLAKK